MGSDGARARWGHGQMGQGQMGPGSDGDRARWGQGQMGPGPDGARARVNRAEILAMVDEVRDAVEHPATRHGSLPALLQVLVALRFYATGRFQNMVAEMVGIDQSTASRTIHRVTNAMLTHIGQWVRLPTQQVRFTYINYIYYN